MLVLARKQNEAIVINDQITIEVLQIKGKTIRLGIQAPREVRIVRGELEPLTESDGASPAAPSSAARSRTSASQKSSQTEGGLSVVADLPHEAAKPASVGLQRFMKDSQVGETVTAYRTRAAESEHSVNENPNAAEPRTTQVSYEGSLNQARTQRVSIVPNSKSSESVKYQTTCEIELPIATFDSNRN